MDFISITESTYKHKFSDGMHDVVCYEVSIFETEQKKRRNWKKIFVGFLSEITALPWKEDHGKKGLCSSDTFNFKFVETKLPKKGKILAYENLSLVKGSSIAGGIGINKNSFYLALLKRLYDYGWELKHFSELPERHWTFQKAVSIASTKKRKLEECQKE